jgi:putative selenium metabolism hydrolase
MNPDLDSLTAFAQSLIRARSLSGDEKQVLQVISAEMTRLGFDRVWMDDTGSLVGVVEGAQPGPTILLDGHCDTVDAHAPDWTRDPWGGQVENGRLYGRGVADMKGSLAAMVHAAGHLDRDRLRGRAAVCASVSEEVAEGGALKSVVESVRPDFVVIGEATDFNLNRGGRGRAEIQVTTFGRSAHSSSPEAGRCAVTDMQRVIQAVASRPPAIDPVLGPGLTVLTDIISAPYPGHSVVPYRCRVTYDRRLLLSDSKDALFSELQSLPGLEDIEYQVTLSAMEERTHTGKVIEGEKFFPAWLLPEEHHFVQAALRGLQSSGLNPKIGAYRFCTNAAYSAGIAAIPTVGFGIGREEDAHTVDESIAVSDLLTAARGYQGIIQAACTD